MVALFVLVVAVGGEIAQTLENSVQLSLLPEYRLVGESAVQKRSMTKLDVLDPEGKLVTIIARIIGPFAIYRRKFAEWGHVDNLWLVRHVRSEESITDYLRSGKQARELAQHLSGMDLDWSFDDPKDAPADVLDAIPKVRDEVVGPVRRKMHCRGATINPRHSATAVIAKNDEDALAHLEENEGWRNGMCPACLELMKLGGAGAIGSAGFGYIDEKELAALMRWFSEEIFAKKRLQER